MAERQATVIWEGTLTEGNGTISTGSGAISNTPVTWASRVEAPSGKTSPEELLAAAEAECYTMVLSNMLTKQNTPPTRLSVTATCTVERVPTGLKITTMRLDVTGEVTGVDEESFRRLAQEAEAACPVSNALRGNVEFSVEASLKESVSA
jgi:lipoyl-dependent peroxiredoxin